MLLSRAGLGGGTLRLSSNRSRRRRQGGVEVLVGGPAHIMMCGGTPGSRPRRLGLIIGKAIDIMMVMMRGRISILTAAGASIVCRMSVMTYSHPPDSTHPFQNTLLLRRLALVVTCPAIGRLQGARARLDRTIWRLLRRPRLARAPRLSVTRRRLRHEQSIELHSGAPACGREQHTMKPQPVRTLKPASPGVANGAAKNTGIYTGNTDAWSRTLRQSLAGLSRPRG